MAARLFWSRPCEASDLPIPSLPLALAAYHLRPVPLVLRAAGHHHTPRRGSFREIRPRCRGRHRHRPRRGGAARPSPRGTGARPPPRPPQAPTSARAASFRARPRPPSAPTTTVAAGARGPLPPAAEDPPQWPRRRRPSRCRSPARTSSSSRIHPDPVTASPSPSASGRSGGDLRGWLRGSVNVGLSIGFASASTGFELDLVRLQ